MSDVSKAAQARDTALQGALTQIERQFGKGTVMRMGDEGAQVRVEAIPTGALSLERGETKRSAEQDASHAGGMLTGAFFAVIFTLLIVGFFGLVFRMAQVASTISTMHTPGGTNQL